MAFGAPLPAAGSFIDANERFSLRQLISFEGSAVMGLRALAWPLSRFAGGGGSGDDLLD